MGSWYAFKGHLAFATAEQAAAEWAKVEADHEGLVSMGSAKLSGKKIVFADGNFSGGDFYYHACAQIQDLAERAISGKVLVQDGEDSRWERISAKGKKPAAKPKPKKKPVAKKKAKPAADGDALLRAVLEHPEDASARAVYADWLQEKGDPRGELIALETQRAQGVTGLDVRIDKLRKKIATAFRKRFENKSTQLEVEGGFVTRVDGQLRWLLTHGEEMFATEGVRSLLVRSPSVGDLPRLAKVKGIERLRWLEIWPPTPKLLAALPLGALPKVSLRLAVRMRELEPYLALRELRRVRALWVQVGLTMEGVEAIATHPSFAELEELDISGHELGDRAAALLVRAPWKLTALDVAGCGFGEAALASLRKRFGIAPKIE